MNFDLQYVAFYESFVEARKSRISREIFGGGKEKKKKKKKKELTFDIYLDTQ